MSSRPRDSSIGNQYSSAETRSCSCTQVTMSSEYSPCISISEGCPVIEESGTVCAETKTLSIINEFREIYQNCIKQMEGCGDDNALMRKLAPFKKLVDDLWEQNTMLVETVEELEREATCRVTMLQEKLNQCSEKVAEKVNDIKHLLCLYAEDVDSLVEVVRRFRENGKLDTDGLKFNTICDAEIFGCCRSSCASENNCASRPDVSTGPCARRASCGGSRCSDDFRPINISLQLVKEDDDDCDCQCCPSCQ